MKSFACMVVGIIYKAEQKSTIYTMSQHFVITQRFCIRLFLMPILEV